MIGTLKVLAWDTEDFLLDLVDRLWKAWRLSWVCYKSSLKVLVHGIFPRWFRNPTRDIEDWLI